jgi:hypothetical protein
VSFFSRGLGLGQDCDAGSDAGQLAVVPASVAAAPAAEAKGDSQDPWSKFCASGEITSAAAAKDVAGSVAQQLKHATQQLKHKVIGIPHDRTHERTKTSNAESSRLRTRC